jgi:hypothetical protein
MSTLQQNWRRGQNRFCLEVKGVGRSGRGQEQRREMATNNKNFLKEGPSKQLTW